MAVFSGIPTFSHLAMPHRNVQHLSLNCRITTAYLTVYSVAKLWGSVVR